MIRPIKVLVFGKNGQVGGQLIRLLSVLPNCEVIGADIDEIDLTDIVGIDDFIVNYAPNWVINASAHTAVDRAESEEALAYILNSEAPEAMAQCCSALGCNFIHYSTDYVFDGTGSEPYLETDSPNPQSVYGRSKVAGEIAVLKQLSSAIIFRTAWVYAKQGNNFVNTMLRLAGERTEITVVDDQIGSPTFADDLAQITVNIVDDIHSGRCRHQGGIFHATGQGCTNWHAFCKEIMALTDDNKIRIKPIPASAYPTVAPRPGYSVLSNQKLLNIYQQQLPHWRDALCRCLQYT